MSPYETVRAVLAFSWGAGVLAVSGFWVYGFVLAFLDGTASVKDPHILLCFCVAMLGSWVAVTIVWAFAVLAVAAFKYLGEDRRWRQPGPPDPKGLR